MLTVSTCIGLQLLHLILRNDERLLFGFHSNAVGVVRSERMLSIAFVDVSLQSYQLAMTACAAQGNAWHAVIVDLMRPPRITPTIFWLSIYVMLSRAYTISGLLILRMPQRADMDIKPPQHLMDEIDRFLELEPASTCSLRKYLKARLPGLPSAVARTFEPLQKQYA